ncbi:MAG: polysaccharide biosynthesis protein, partial [Paramuribaculum sp.]|nr:polysaccharide biosynthesis protein [Paramuribaculum sp.]
MNKLNLGLSSYLKATVVLAIDVLVSLIASVCVLLFVLIVAPTVHSSSNFVLGWIGSAAATSAIAFYCTRVYRLIIRYSTLKEFGKLSLAVLVKDVLLWLIMLMIAQRNSAVSYRLVTYLVILDFFVSLGALIFVRVLMMAVYLWLTRKIEAQNTKTRVLVYGTGGKAASLVTRLRNSKQFEVVGFLKYGPKYKDQILAGLPIYYFDNESNISGLRRKLNIDGVLFAHQHEAREEKERLIVYCQDTSLKMYLAPSIDEMTDGKLPSSGIRKIRIEDLLGRSEIKISMDEIKANVEGKTILVTGAAGSIGSELCRQLAQLGIKELIMYDNAETPLHNVRLEFEEKFPNLKFTPVIGDVR